ncbi:GGDEF domain-containing protein [Vibrio hyugaensis]|uniref:diguanylate cyclase n=1 Tax=Vibrio hyugaensis TaxID=1534743 RepID=A0ABQ5Y5Q3_9VIBR|nr:GGDEF domain-containing protein [Vibrio hyugaensis]GLR04937.1 GGDEF domain-containing protein [Vibrio hyugaensis]
MNLKNIYLSFFFAALLFISSITMIGAMLISHEVKQFKIYTQGISKTKQKVTLLGLLMESELARYEGLTAQEISDITEFSIQDAIYALEPGSELDYVEAVARKVLNEAEGYLSNVYERIDVVLYFRSYTANKLILESPIDELENLSAPFDIDWCKETKSCVLAAWKNQLADRILISQPFKTTYSDSRAFNVISPVYYQGDIVGEFGEQIFLDSLTEEGKALKVDINNGNKHVVVYYPRYPWPDFAYTQTYVADNNNLIVYKYPFSKILIDFGFLFLIMFASIYGYYSKAQESKESKIQLANAISDATKDELTGLFNRKVFKEQAFKNKIKMTPFTVIAIDGDRVKRINDKYGHHVGDEVIVIIADAMKKVFRTTDYLIRTGGDEFIAILPRCSESKSLMLAKKLQFAVGENRLKTLNIDVSVSTGLATSSEHETLNDVIMRADEDLYETKRHRSDKVVSQS